ncbi:MAG TPA: TonB family protein [Thermoanaerobaculia bacterium]|jgi:protein TonB|nr:TonB family protein [Thermoanaerobaculia bacterium]
MFETVAPDAFARRDRHILYESLPVSIALHAAAFIAVAVVIVSHVTLPVQPPKILVGYLASELGDPVPPPLPPAPAKQPDAPKHQPKVESSVALKPIDLAPTTIPNEVDQMPLPSPMRLVSASIDKLVPAAGVAGGVNRGVRAGVTGGVLGGSVEGVTGGIVGGDGRMHFERDSRLPLVMEEHPYPVYPKSCREAKKEGIVVVRYVIGKDGRVNDVSILHHAARKEFDESTLEAVRKWRFRPLLIDGEPMEVVHEMTVFFELH